ncbi:MAG: TraR/DksA C4-type zinc finger protein [Kiritimatiellia bacterium]
MPVQKKTTTKKNSSAQNSVKKSPAKKIPASKDKPAPKPSVKKSTVKKASVKKSAVKKTSTKKSAVKKSVLKKKPGKVKKSTSELLEAIKALDAEAQTSTDLNQKPLVTASNKQPSAKVKTKAKKQVSLPIVPPMQKAVEVVAPSSSRNKKKRKASFGKKDLKMFRNELLGIREHFTQQTKTMRHDALQREDGVNSEEDGTDAFMRLQVLNQMSNQHRTIADIDEALNDIATGAYGICEMCECLISKLRLKARPFARFCIKCKSEMERADRFNKPR